MRLNIRNEKQAKHQINCKLEGYKTVANGSIILQHQHHSNRPIEFSSGTKTLFTCIMATIFKGWCRLGFSNGYTTVRNDASCLKQDYSNRPTDFTAGTKTEFITKNGGHLEKWAPYWILKKLQSSKP